MDLGSIQLHQCKVGFVLPASGKVAVCRTLSPARSIPPAFCRWP